MNSTYSIGTLLPATVLHNLEVLFGESFEHVKIHIGSAPTEIGAIAYASGENLYFSPDSFDVKSPKGIWLLGHELAHIVQQRYGRVQANSVSHIVQDSYLEMEADIWGVLAVLATKGIYLPFISFPKISGEYRRNSVAVVQCVIVDNTEYKNKLFTTYEVKYKIKDNILLHYVNLDIKIWDNLIMDLLNSSSLYTLKDVIEIIYFKSKTSAKIIQRKYINHKNIQSTLLVENIQGLKFINKRKEEIEKWDMNHFLAEIYGFQTAKIVMTNDNTYNLSSSIINTEIYWRSGSIISTEYWRGDYQNGYIPFAKKVIEKYCKENNMTYDDDYKIINCVNEVKLKHLGLSAEKISEIAPGMFLVKKHNIGITNRYGLAPSIYALSQYLYKQPNAENKQKIINDYKTITDDINFKTLKNIKVKNIVLDIIIKSIEGISFINTNKNTCGSIYVKEAIYNIRKIISLLLITKNYVTIINLYELFTNELLIILGIAQEYDSNKFKKIISDLYESRIPVIKGYDLNRTTCIEANGMSAILTAFTAALIEKEDSKIYIIQPINTYFELDDQISAKTTTKLKEATIFYTTLNSSTPKEETNISEIINNVKDGINNHPYDKINLIIDITVELGENDNNNLYNKQLNEIFKELLPEIKNSKLNILLAKSTQKYSSLGTGKISSGIVLAINKGINYLESNKYLSTLSDENKYISHYEQQLITHFIKYCANEELLLTNNASENASIIAKCLESNQKYINNLPFVLTTFDDYILEKVDLEKWFEINDIYKRSSFGFLSTTYLLVGNGNINYRISAGQESKEQIIEMFVGINKDYKNKKEELKKDPNFKQFIDSIDASEIYCLKLIDIKNLNDLQLRLSVISNLMKISDQGKVSKYTQEIIAQEYLKLVLNNNKGIDISADEFVRQLVIYQKYQHHLPIFKKIRIFTDNLSDDRFISFSQKLKQDIITIFFRGADYLTKISACERLISIGKFKIAQSLLDYIESDFNIYKIGVLNILNIYSEIVSQSTINMSVLIFSDLTSCLSSIKEKEYTIIENLFEAIKICLKENSGLYNIMYENDNIKIEYKKIILKNITHITKNGVEINEDKILKLSKLGVSETTINIILFYLKDKNYLSLSEFEENLRIFGIISKDEIELIKTAVRKTIRVNRGLLIEDITNTICRTSEYNIEICAKKLQKLIDSKEKDTTEVRKIREEISYNLIKSENSKYFYQSEIKK